MKVWSGGLRHKDGDYKVSVIPEPQQASVDLDALLFATTAGANIITDVLVAHS